MAGSAELTILIPTRNRPGHLGALVRFLRAAGTRHPIMVADSSEGERALAVKAACEGTADYWGFRADLPISDKMVAALKTVATEFVVLLPDDDISLPSAIDTSLAFLRGNPDYVASNGYVLDCGITRQAIDITEVRWFTPSIDAERPLTRVYDLMRRYQPFLWSVFRTPAIITAIDEARMLPRIVFQEMMIMNSMAVQGKIHRSRKVFTLRGMEESQTRLGQVNPFYGFLENTGKFVAEYTQYRFRLLQLLKRIDPNFFAAHRMTYYAESATNDAAGSVATSDALVTPEQVLDLIHAILFTGEVDRGMLNYSVQRALGAQLPPIPVGPQWRGERPVQPGDILRDLGDGASRVIWREAALTAEPREEIEIGEDERAEVERQIRHYRLD